MDLIFGAADAVMSADADAAAHQAEDTANQAMGVASQAEDTANVANQNSQIAEGISVDADKKSNQAVATANQANATANAATELANKTSKALDQEIQNEKDTNKQQAYINLQGNVDKIIQAQAKLSGSAAGPECIQYLMAEIGADKLAQANTDLSKYMAGTLTWHPNSPAPTTSKDIPDLTKVSQGKCHDAEMFFFQSYSAIDKAVQGGNWSQIVDLFPPMWQAIQGICAARENASSKDLFADQDVNADKALPHFQNLMNTFKPLADSKFKDRFSQDNVKDWNGKPDCGPDVIEAQNNSALKQDVARRKAAAAKQPAAVLGQTATAPGQTATPGQPLVAPGQATTQRQRRPASNVQTQQLPQQQLPPQTQSQAYPGQTSSGAVAGASGYSPQTQTQAYPGQSSPGDAAGAAAYQPQAQSQAYPGQSSFGDVAGAAGSFLYNHVTSNAGVYGNALVGAAKQAFMGTAGGAAPAQ